MRFECDAPQGLTWFRLETAAEAEAEAAAMVHAVDACFKRAEAAARASFRPGPGLERDIGLKDHLFRVMPLFLTLRDEHGAPCVTAMVPRHPVAGDHDLAVKPILVAQANKDPYPRFAEAIQALARHLGRPLDPKECYPYRRG